MDWNVWRTVTLNNSDIFREWSDTYIIVNKQYNVKSLINTENDTTTICEKLLDNAITAIESKGKDAGAVVFYFTEHGLQIEGINYFTAIDTNISDKIS